MKTILHLASFASFGGCLTCAVFFLMAFAEMESGALIIFAGGSLTFLGQFIVFQFVAQRLDEPAPDETLIHRSNSPSEKSNLAGTPWEKNSSHTMDR